MTQSRPHSGANGRSTGRAMGMPCCIPGCNIKTLNRRYRVCGFCWKKWVVSRYNRSRVKLRELRDDPEMRWLYELILESERRAYAIRRDRDMVLSYEELAEKEVLDELMALYKGAWGSKRKTTQTVTRQDWVERVLGETEARVHEGPVTVTIETIETVEVIGGSK